ncbi:MAG: acetoin utilization deacetylase AcuC-like enzyme [Verrucomicrobiales bacterium]|jgi:acetoin utilization deacetylase AcuC-like enzyme
MLIVQSDEHLAHAPKGEIHDGKLVQPFESPERIAIINDALVAAGLRNVAAPKEVPDELLAAVHDPLYLDFLRTAWSQWVATGSTGDMIPICFPARRMVQEIPEDIDGRLGYFAFAADTAITSGTWRAARGAASLAYTAQQHTSSSGEASFALCRPPGHHASRDFFGGYCFVNNAAVAAQGFLDDGALRVAVLDVDFHHGNGTQDIFYEREDVFFASLHGHPSKEFPHFLGFEGETGSGEGFGFNANYPLQPGTTFDVWRDALEDALRRIALVGVDALVVSLGVDTFESDPISSFNLRTEDFATYGRIIGKQGVPTVYCMEGGYAVEAIGRNVVGVLTGHLDGP